MLGNLKIKISHQIDGSYKVKVKGVGTTYAKSLEDAGVALEELIKINDIRATN